MERQTMRYYIRETKLEFKSGGDTSKANEGEQRRAPVTEGGYWGLGASSGTDTKTTLQQQYLRAPLRTNTKTPSHTMSRDVYQGAAKEA